MIVCMPTHSEVFNSLEMALKWYERQDERDTIQLLFLKCFLT